MLAILTIVLGLSMTLLAIPVWVSYTLSWHRAFRIDATVQWAFGLVNVKIPGGDPKVSSKPVDVPKFKDQRRDRSQKARGNILLAARQAALRARILRFARDLWRALRKRDVDLRVRLGLGDPADTGQLWAVCGPLSAALANVRDVTVAVEPDFLNQTFEVDGRGTVRVIPLQILCLVAALLLSPSVWNGIRQIRGAR
jgi:hypothetical protein